MSDMDRLFFSIGALSAGLGVALGAFGAHALKARLTPDLLAVWETGVRYQIYHAFGLMAVHGRHPHHRHRSRHQPLARACARPPRPQCAGARGAARWPRCMRCMVYRHEDEATTHSLPAAPRACPPPGWPGTPPRPTRPASPSAPPARATTVQGLRAHR
jgi:hypothetical protein